MNNNPLRGEGQRLLVTLLLSVMIGFLAGSVFICLIVGVIGFLLWHVVQAIRYVNWLFSDRQSIPSDIGGVWGEVYYRMIRLRTKHRKSKQRLGGYLKRFRQLTAALPDAVVVLTADKSIEWFNDTAKSLLRLRPSVDVGQRIGNLIRHPRFIDYLGSNDYQEPIQLPSPFQDNQSLLIYLIPYGAEQLLLVVRDITRLSHLEQVRKDFVANVSHELSTPLTVVSGYIEVLTQEVNDPADARYEALKQIDHQTTRMKHIVSDLLLLSRLEVAEQNAVTSKVIVPALLSDLKNQLVGLADVHQQLTFIVQDDLCLKGDERELFSAFSNLFTNALKYTPPNGEINIKWYLDGGNAVFEVKDTGNGIPAHDIPRLTERFFRVDNGRSRDKGGTGLGLAIVKHVLTHHDARLVIESQVGKGSTFKCIFPEDRVIWPVPYTFSELKSQAAKAL